MFFKRFYIFFVKITEKHLKLIKKVKKGKK